MGKKENTLVNKGKPQRQPGLDIIRVLALLFVISFHSFLYNGYYYTPQIGAQMWLAGSFRWMSVSCIGLFLMLSGYLKCENTDVKSGYKAALSALISYALAVAISIPIRHHGFEQVYSKPDWMTKIFNYTAVSYGWYVEMFIGLCLIIPFINIAIKNMSNKQLYWFAAATLILTALPGATKWQIAADYWRITYPVTYYVLGAIVRRVQPKVNPLLGIFEALVMAALLGFVTVNSTDDYLSSAKTWEFADIWIAFIVFWLFVSLYRLNVPKVVAKVLAVASYGCYGGYLLSYLFDAWCYKKVPHLLYPDGYFKLFLCVTVPIWIASIICGIGLQKVTDLIMWPINKMTKKKSN